MSVPLLILLSLLAIAFAVVRFFITSRELSWAGTYQAFAHLFVGWLFGAGYASHELRYLYIAGALTLVEIVAFISKKK